MFRRWLLILSLPPLVLGLCLLRSHRFERVADEPTFGMAALKSALPDLPEGAEWQETEGGTMLRVTARASAPDVSLGFRLPVAAPVEALHVMVETSSNNLVRGEREWEDGRILLRWLPERENGASEIDPVTSVRGSEKKGGVSLVTQPSFGTGYPVLVIENLATSGEMIVSGLELTPVKYRRAWFWMRWVLAACWFSWLVALVSGVPKIPFPRRAAAAILWLVMGILFAFPGPWKRLSPMLVPYDLGGRAELLHEGGDGKAVVPQTKTPRGMVSQGAFGQIPDQSGWIIQLRHYLKKQRLLLHFGFVVGITFVFTCLVGLRRATWLVAGLVLAMEGSQTGFGYGFDFDDFLDLACGAAGIMLGRLVFGKLCRWKSFSRWMALPPAELSPPTVADRAPDERNA